MNRALGIASAAASRVNALAPAVIGTVGRIVFAAVLMIYFWNSGVTKLGPGLLGFLSPSDGAYVQIFPKAAETAGYDFSQFGVFHWAVVVAGTVAEFVLPLLIVIGLLTRLAAVGMIGFVVVQSLTDIYGHSVGASGIGRWFDAASDSAILDQRALWSMLLLTLAMLGAGPLSLDRLFFSERGLKCAESCRFRHFS